MTSAESSSVSLPDDKKSFNWKRLVFMFTGIGLFVFVYYCPPLPDAIDPMGEHFVLSQQAKGALAVFLLAATWWVFEVVPIGVTSLTIGVLQALFMIREPKVAFKDFMDPSVLFIFGSIVIGMVFTKTGLTKRIAYKMLSIVGEKTSMIYLGCFVMTAALTHVMAHTAVAATMFPLLMAIHALYTDEDGPTKFGKAFCATLDATLDLPHEILQDATILPLEMKLPGLVSCFCIRFVLALLRLFNIRFLRDAICVFVQGIE